MLDSLEGLNLNDVKWNSNNEKVSYAHHITERKEKVSYGS